jgi:hypothetical protein
MSGDCCEEELLVGSREGMQYSFPLAACSRIAFNLWLWQLIKRHISPISITNFYIRFSQLERKTKSRRKARGKFVFYGSCLISEKLLGKGNILHVKFIDTPTRDKIISLNIFVHSALTLQASASRPKRIHSGDLYP